jgi:hypothetical protein
LKEQEKRLKMKRKFEEKMRKEQLRKDRKEKNEEREIKKKAESFNKKEQSAIQVSNSFVKFRQLLKLQHNNQKRKINEKRESFEQKFAFSKMKKEVDKEDFAEVSILTWFYSSILGDGKESKREKR